MSVDVTVPQLGESIVEATVGQWLKHEGETVSVGEPLVSLETDKVNMEVAANAAGVLQSIVKGEGETVAIGDMLARIVEHVEAGVHAPEPAAAPAGAVTEQAIADIDVGRATPLARRIAEEHGVDIRTLQGSGPGGRVTQDDVTALVKRRGNGTSAPPPATTMPPVSAPVSAGRPAPAAPAGEPRPAPAAPPSPAVSRREERVRLSRRRQTIARRLVEAQHAAAMLTTFNEVDMSAIIELRKRRRDAFKERHGVGLGFMSFFTRAVIGALKAFPRLNAEIQGDEMILKHYFDIGIAVGVEEGLVVPVLRDADRLTFAEIERQIASLAEKARKNALSLEELQGGTFTITNGGTFGSLLSTPILNSPQVGILGMHKIEERPIALNGQVVIHPMMYVALSYDHRIVDGNEAVRFLVRVKELLEDPETLLLEG